MIRRVKRHPEFELRLDLLGETFIRPPRDAQRQWVLNQAMAEFADDLVHLDRLTREFVPGRERSMEGYDVSEATLDDQEIMEDWQIPLMRAMVAQVAAPGRDLLEIGFGRGISATMIQEAGVRSHTIVEANPANIRDAFQPWRAARPDADIRLVAGRWQDVRSGLGQFDAIFFHPFPLTEEDILEHVVGSITYAEHGMADMASMLRPGGVMTYFTAETDSLARRHQRLLFRYFSEIRLSLVDLELPPDTADAWWSKSMVVIQATR